VSENQIGGITFEVLEDTRRRFIKWAPTASGVDLHSEVARLTWAGPADRDRIRYFRLLWDLGP
jgi:hypothetical protein